MTHEATWVNLEERYIPSEISQTQTNKDFILPLYELPRRVKFKETREQKGIARGWEKERVKHYCLIGT